MTSLLPVPKIQFIDSNGEPIVNGKVYTYEAGTTNPQETWQDYTKSQLNENPVELDDAGRASIWLDGWYKIVLKNAQYELVYEVDNIGSISDINLAGLTATVDDLNSTTTTAKIIASDYDVTADDRGKNLLVNTLSTDVEINLPSAVLVGNKYKITIKKVDESSNRVVVFTDENESIDSVQDVFYLDCFNDFIEILSDGSNWSIVAEGRRGVLSDYDNSTSPLDIVLMDHGRTILLDASSGNITVNLPDIDDVGNGFAISLKKIDISANVIIVNPIIGQKIDGANLLELAVSYQCYTLRASNIGWNITAFRDPVSTFTTGDIKASYKTSEEGWLILNDNRIGNASSGAEFASERAKNLYILLYNNVTDEWCHVSGGRSGNAENDFNGGKTLKLPEVAGRALCSAGVGEHLSIRELGEHVGEEEHILTIPELVSHSHNVRSYNHKNEPRDLKPGGQHVRWGYSSEPTETYDRSSSNSGGSLGHNIMQPSAFVHYFIKL